MKLCYLADNRSIHTKRWVEYFARDNEVHLITMNYPEGQLDINVHEIHYIPYGPSSILNELKVKRIVRDIQPDVLHAHFATHYGYWGACSGFHPLVVSCWGDDVLIHPHQWPLSMLVKMALTSADLITCDGVNSALAVRDIIGSNDKIVLIPHGIDLTRFNKHYNQLSKTVIYMRGFEPVYDWVTFVKVVRKIPDTTVLVLGGGSQMEEAKEWLDRCPNVKFIGPVGYDEIPRWLGLADVYVSTAKSEGGLALSMIEAMASGVVPVVTDVGDNRHVIHNWTNGFVCPVGDVDGITERIRVLLDTPTIRGSIGTVNRQRVEQNQDYRYWMKVMGTLYRGLLL